MAKKDKTEYVIGDIGSDGFEIRNIIGSTSKFIIYLNDKNELRWERADDFQPKQFNECIARLDRYQSMIKNSLPKSQKRTYLLESLGQALHSSLLTESKEEALQMMDEIGTRVSNEITLYARRRYVSASMFATTFICLTFALLNMYGMIGLLMPYWLSAGAGAVGSTLSILLRSSSLEMPPFSTPFEYFFQGMIRVILGLLSGLILVILINAEFLFGFAKNNLEVIIVFGIIAGFGERYLPNVLFDFEKKS
jgi:hypothetical protein